MTELNQLILRPVGTPNSQTPPTGTIDNPVPPGTPFVVDYNFWIPVESTPYADQLLQVNEVVVDYDNTETTGGSLFDDANVNIVVDAPVITTVKSSALASGVAKGATASNVEAGSNVFFRIDVVNSGHAPAFEVVVTDTIPSNLTLVGPSITMDTAGTPPTVTVGAGTITFSFTGANSIGIGADVGFEFECTTAATLVTGSKVSVANTTSTVWEPTQGGTTPYAPVTSTNTPVLKDPAITLALTAGDLSPGRSRCRTWRRARCSPTSRRSRSRRESPTALRCSSIFPRVWVGGRIRRGGPRHDQSRRHGAHGHAAGRGRHQQQRSSGWDARHDRLQHADHGHREQRHEEHLQVTLRVFVLNTLGAVTPMTATVLATNSPDPRRTMQLPRS